MAVVFEGQGHWWLPGKEQKRVPGIITFDSDSGADLALIGALSSWRDHAEVVQLEGGGIRMDKTPEVQDRSGVYPMINGQIESHHYSLEDCLQTRISEDLFSGSGSRERIHANRAYKDVLWEEGETPAADGLSFSTAYLDDWVAEKYIDRSEFFTEGSGWPIKYALSVEQQPERAIALEHNTKLTLRHHIGYGGRRSTKTHLEQGYSIKLDLPAVTPMVDVMDIASDFQDLISIATGRSAAFENIWGYHPDVVRPTMDEDGEQLRMPFQMFASWSVKDTASKPNEIDPHEVFFGFQDLGGMEGLVKWMRAAELHRSTLGRTMGTRTASRMYLSDRLLNYVAALEGFDRQHTQSRSRDLKARLRRSARLAGEPFQELVGRVGKWVELVDWHRNDIAHHLGRTPRGAATTRLWLAESAYWLAVFVMLRVAEAPEAVFKRITEHQEFQFKGRRIRATVQAGQTT